VYNTHRGRGRATAGAAPGIGRRGGAGARARVCGAAAARKVQCPAGLGKGAAGLKEQWDMGAPLSWPAYQRLILNPWLVAVGSQFPVCGADGAGRDPTHQSKSAERANGPPKQSRRSAKSNSHRLLPLCHGASLQTTRAGDDQRMHAMLLLVCEMMISEMMISKVMQPARHKADQSAGTQSKANWGGRPPLTTNVYHNA
jgi:hypothetical protein